MSLQNSSLSAATGLGAIETDRLQLLKLQMSKFKTHVVDHSVYGWSTEGFCPRPCKRLRVSQK